MLIFITVIYFLKCLLCFSALCGRSSEPSVFVARRIIGGQTPRQHSWPWIVSIHKQDEFQSTKFICGGSLISDRYVLTAAHCFYNINRLKDYFVLMGSHYLNETHPVRMSIRSIRLHENYDNHLYANDIALIELTCHMSLSTKAIRSICLPPKNIPNYPYDYGIVAGWGSSDENGTTSQTLQQVRLPLISLNSETCKEQIYDNKTQFCAGSSEGGIDACQGDSGGPLMFYDPFRNETWNVAGIISYGYGCARAEHPGVYTRVSMYVDWIEKYTSSSSIKQISFEILLLLFIVVMYF